MGYRQYQPQLMNTPLQDPYGASYQRALGIVKDWCVQRTRTSVQQRFPDYALPDALGAIGDERSLFQGNSIQLGSAETSIAFATRLKKAWNTWKLGGTAWGMLQAFAAQGYFPQLVCANGIYYSVNGSLVLSITTQSPLSTLPWDYYFVWFGTAPSSWTNIGSPPTTSTVPARTDIQLLRKIIRTWQPAWAVCMGIAVVTGGADVWGAPGLEWGAMGLEWGEGTVTWYSATDELEWGFPPNDSNGDYAWGAGSLTWAAEI